tara:strand:+ start:624 stop:1055 length:432 start_codon:yes stop_codon:yes gene_type:complete
MKTETIIYKKRLGVNTKEVLRTINEQDQTWIKTVMQGYLKLTMHNADTSNEFKTWFNHANDQLPKLSLVGHPHNSPRTFAEGIIEKLEQAPSRRDLSPRQCEGIEVLSMQMSLGYNIPDIKFVENGMQKEIKTEFKSLFKKQK